MSKQLEKVKELIDLRTQARMGGGEKAIEKQHAKGKIYSPRTHLHAFRRRKFRRNGHVCTASVY